MSRQENPTAVRRISLLGKHLTSSSDDGLLSSLSKAASNISHGIAGSVEMSLKHGGMLVADVLKAHGVKFVFTLVGGHISPILVASRQQGIRIIDVRHEVTAMFAADAVGRLTGKPGVAAVTAGPGITNTITAVKNAQMAQSPVVLLGGCAASLLRGRGSLQDIDQMAVIAPIVKYSASIDSVRSIVPILRRAFHEAMSGVPGPVFVEFPIDLLYNIFEIQSSMGLSERIRKKQLQPEQVGRVIVPDGEGENVKTYLDKLGPEDGVFLKSEGDGQNSWFVEQYMNYQLKKTFSGAWSPQDVRPLPFTIPMPDPDDVKKALDLLVSAQRPVVIIGSQAMLHGLETAQELQKSMEGLGVPVFLGGMARGLLGARSSMYIKQNRGNALKHADVVILAGGIADFRLQYGRSFNKNSKIVAINRSKKDLFLNSDIFWKPTLASQSDPCHFLLQLCRSASSVNKSLWDPWLAKLKDADRQRESSNFEKVNEVAEGRGEKDGEKLVNPLALCFELESKLPDKSILVADGGDFVATASYILKPRGPLTWLDPGAFGTLGVGGGFALGAKLCRPDHEVWLIWGDGSCGYSVAEYDTFVRHNVPIIGLVGNDACWTQIEREQVPMFKDDVACPISYCKYDAVAEGYGARGFEIENANENVGLAIENAQDCARSGMPCLLNVMIGSTDFREGSLSV